ncbi:hypothetical protein RHMOL_Rhmol09G0010800 [Rhododendron molle]|uniref:Uncharacterized protein n=1 Tax=Rhododendron molle TaxID=49168 RepID=A0ACC0MA49_RHOML|nr:hypothetical protein RHMOL_Rhmol09G0010800 [Rhododendron molle]
MSRWRVRYRQICLRYSSRRLRSDKCENECEVERKPGSCKNGIRPDWMRYVFWVYYL